MAIFLIEHGAFFTIIFHHYNWHVTKDIKNIVRYLIEHGSRHQ